MVMEPHYIPSPHEIATATCRRCKRRPTDVSGVERKMMWKEYKNVALLWSVDSLRNVVSEMDRIFSWKMYTKSLGRSVLFGKD